jgi:hypothetical protein
MSARTAPSRRVVPAQARTVAGRLVALFDRDRQLADRLGAAQRRLHAANDQLRPGSAVDLLRPACDRHPPDREAAAGGSGRFYWELHGAFWDYQQASEHRRQLAFEVGELAQQLTDALTGAGWSTTDARTADVYQLARQKPGR